MRIQFVRFSLFILVAVAGSASAQSAPPSSGPQQPATIAGVWVLNPALTQRPSEIGFDRNLAEGERGGEGSARPRRGRGGGSGGETGAPMISRESADDATRVDQLTAEARTPPAHLAIVRKADSVAIADDQGHSRTFHPTGKQENLTVGTVPLPTTARWDGTSLVVVYDVESGWQLRYTYTPSASPARLLVDIRFLERGHEGDEVKLTYEPEGATPTQPAATPPAQPSSPAAAPSAPAPGAIGAPPATRARVLPPGSELRGLTTIGTEVDDLTPEGTACGLDRDTIKASVARILTDAGFKAQPYGGDEESYVLLTVMTSKLPNGTCVSRYDASLVSQADATFPYLSGLVNVPVQLLHDGGMVGGSAASHPSAVMNALTKSVNGFVSQIRATNK